MTVWLELVLCSAACDRTAEASVSDSNLLRSVEAEDVMTALRSALLNSQLPEPGGILAAGSRSMEIREGREEQKSSVIVGKKHSEESTETSDCGQTAGMNLRWISNLIQAEHKQGLYLRPPSLILAYVFTWLFPGFEVWTMSRNCNQILVLEFDASNCEDL